MQLSELSDRAQGDGALNLSAKALVMLLMATATADHVCVKWTCKAGWGEWVDFAPPNLQNASTCENRRHFCTHPGAYPGKALL